MDMMRTFSFFTERACGRTDRYVYAYAMVYKLILDFKEMSKEKKQSPLTKYIFQKSSPKTRKKKA